MRCLGARGLQGHPRPAELRQGQDRLRARPSRRSSAARRYNLKAGQKKTITVKLGKGLRSLVKKNVMKVKAQAVSRDALGNQTTRTANLSLKLEKAKKSKK